MTNQANIKITAEDKTAAAFASASRGFDKLGGAAAAFNHTLAAIGTLATATGAAALSALVLESSKAIDEFNDLADATGASIENISALDRVARETGGSFADVSSILTKFNKVLAEAEPDKGAGAVLKAMNLDIEELKRLDPAEALRRTAVALSQYADDGAKGRAITVLFGRSVREVAPFLKDLSEQTALHATTSTQAAEEAEKFNKELYKLKASSEDFARSMSINVITVLNETIEKFREGQREGRGFLSIANDRYWENVGKFYEGYGKYVRGIYREMGLVGGEESKAGGGRGFVSPDLVDPNAPRPSLNLPEEPKKKTGTGGAAKDPFAEAKRYLENLQRQLEKTRELGLEEQALAEIQSGRMGKVNPALEQQILSTARLIDLNKAEKDNLEASERAGKKASDEAKAKLEQAAELAKSVETPFEALQRELAELDKLVQNNPNIGAETAARLGTKYWQDYLKTLEDVNAKTSELDLFTQNAVENIQGYLGDTFQQAMEGNFDNIGDAFVRMINRMVAEAVAADLARWMFGGKAQGGSGTGVLDSLINAGMSYFFGGGGFDMYGGAQGAANSAIMSGVNAGGFGGVSGADQVTDALFRSMKSYDVGTDFVPYDQVALIHKGERIVPAAENRPDWGAPSQPITVYVTAPQGTSRASATQWGAEVGRQIEHSRSRVRR